MPEKVFKMSKGKKEVSGILSGAGFFPSAVWNQLSNEGEMFMGNIFILVGPILHIYCFPLVSIWWGWHTVK